jgi:hypothetical protein
MGALNNTVFNLPHIRVLACVRTIVSLPADHLVDLPSWHAFYTTSSAGCLTLDRPAGTRRWSGRTSVLDLPGMN